MLLLEDTVQFCLLPMELATAVEATSTIDWGLIRSKITSFLRRYLD